MTDADLLAALKVDLGITGTGYDTRLSQVITAAIENIAREGAVINTQRMEDCQIVIMYAGWMWRRRDTMEAMPRMLRWALNNRIFSAAAGGSVDPSPSASTTYYTVKSGG